MGSVHYPFDGMGGWLLRAVIGVVLHLAGTQLASRWAGRRTAADAAAR